MPSAFSIPDNQGLVQTLAPAARTATANGAGVESGGDSYARAAILHFGAWTDGTHKFTFDRSTDPGTVGWTEMTAEELDDPAEALDTGDLNSVNVTDDTNDGDVVQIGLLTTDSWTRVTDTISGASTGQVASAIIQDGHPKRFAGQKGNPATAAGILFATP